eukprot:TRINITY_DN2526_c0_g1_i3.p1 TRINITY_DN2526_c0_g1~~TRINITY_DN2526_c0_g1_i3.p1  ORF type:complete len:394 (-),score=78.96 TRINITY_DN2526_c0_g1_i3:66-1247(-)
MATEAPARKRVVIVGGGYAGRELLKHFYKHASKVRHVDFILVDRKEYSEHSTPAVRFLVDHDYYAGMAARYMDMYPRDNHEKHAITSGINVSFIQGEVQAILPGDSLRIIGPDAQAVDIPFNVLVMAVGAKYPHFRAEAPLLAQRTEEIRQLAQTIHDAQHVLIIGGGAVGCETAGEIIHKHPGKRVTLATAAPTLLEGTSAFAQIKAEQFLTQRGVVVQYNTRIDPAQVQPGNRVFTTSTNQTIEADLALLTIGNGEPNTLMFREHFEHLLSPRGLIKVRPSLQAENVDNIFALGDCMYFPNAIKAVANIPDQVKVVVKNVLNLLSSKPKPKAPAQYIKGGFVVPPLVSLGPAMGILTVVHVFGWSPNGPKVGRMKTTKGFEPGKPKMPEKA